MSIFSQLILLAIVVIVLAVTLRLVFRKPESTDRAADTSAAPDKYKKKRQGTLVMTRFEVAVTDASGKRGCFNIPDKPDHFSIGTAENDDIRINDDTVSRSHIVIGYDEQSLFLRDNNSSNGTRLERSRQAERVTRDLDIVDGLTLYLGRDTALVFRDTYADAGASDASADPAVSAGRERVVRQSAAQ